MEIWRPKRAKENSYMFYYIELYSFITWHAQVNDCDQIPSRYSSDYSNSYPT